MRIITTIVLLILLMALSSCALYHHYGAYSGKVIDDETNEPIEGVVILAIYRTWLHISPGGPASYFLDTQEVMTDVMGEFSIPALNAFAFRPLSTFSSLNPYITIFKPRYKCNQVRLTENQRDLIRLKRLKTNEERISNLRSCYPSNVPDNRMLNYLELENNENMDLGLGERPMRKELYK